ncbi:amidohydrolase family protein [Dokdonella fugitiva]|jgi:aminocarboxymuconate-semialdehyde decarboxylase|uniref:2-amino-3-carboxymuconate-6-semialdehyde decarboxylase n=1 Tax=Dokdonella fugitiva TaxID=328517 RepID=A0A4R2ICD7_9GAMM|nr:amidohydrolase family protein [Dokdonella fugitiva]MBA8883806.1 aminocarboxymuconate-semialdehyde decarboxylase [Dokdonella fugitiva]TCO41796.1 aminocarboxymuconate-semialdehyde decarboxylase [Dokdonella fugitiva]
MLKIDTHAHILPPDWPNLAEKYGDDRFPVMVRAEGRHRIYKDGKFFREVWANAFDPEVRIADYAKFGVDVQVVSTVPVLFSYWAKPNQALELHRHLNDHTAELCRRYPRHYAGIGTVPLQSPTLAIQEMERCIEQLGLSGVQIGSHCENWNLDAPELFPFFEAAAEIGAAILVHPWDMMGAASMPKYWLPWLVGMPAEQSRAVCCLIFGGVLERLPRLKVCFAHGGGSFPYTIGRIEHGFRMRPDLVATDNARGPREYLDRLYFDSCVHDRAALRYLLDVAGADHIMLGTDYPFPLGEQEPGSGIIALGLPPTEQARLFHGTALEWLGLPLSRFADDTE